MVLGYEISRLIIRHIPVLILLLMEYGLGADRKWLLSNSNSLNPSFNGIWSWGYKEK